MLGWEEPLKSPGRISALCLLATVLGFRHGGPQVRVAAAAGHCFCLRKKAEAPTSCLGVSSPDFTQDFYLAAFFLKKVKEKEGVLRVTGSLCHQRGVIGFGFIGVSLEGEGGLQGRVGGWFWF